MNLINKDRVIESIKSENIDPNIRNSRKPNSENTSSFLQQRKRDRDLEAKIKQLEGIISDERKHMGRLQQLNTQLLGKIKGFTNSEKVTQNESETYTKSFKTLKKEYNNLRQDKKQILDEYMELKDKFNQLIDENEQLAAKYDSLLKSSKLFEENALELYESHQLLTEKLMRHLGRN